VVAERARVRDELLAQGWTVPPTEANFVWLPLAGDTGDFAAACARSGVSIRPFTGDGARISIGSEEENGHLLAVARAYPRRH
jgi:histidinol-phosphate aminotransferase